MYVSHVKLVNIRSFPDTDLSLSKGINLLVGNNNSGKSSIIKSIYKLQNTHIMQEDDVRKTKDFGRIFIDLDDISPTDGRIFTYNRDIKHFPKSNKFKVLFGLYNSAHGRKKSLDAFYFDANLNWHFDETFRIKFDSQEKNELIEFSSLPNLETQNNFIYPFFAKRKTNYYSRGLGTKDAYTIGEDLSNITSKIQKLSNPSHPKNKLFVKHLNDILGFSIGVIPFRENEFNAGIFVKDSMAIPIESMGEGVVNIVGLIVMLLTEDKKLYLIEELENDIHPQALKKLLNLILEKAKHNQFIISTHSNIIVKYLGIESSKIFQITWLPYEKQKSDKLPTSKVSVVGTDPQSKLILLESLGYDLFDFELYKSYLIFEESSAEKIVRDFLIPEFIPSLYQKIKTVAASGTADIEPRLHAFLRLFVFIHQNPIYFSRVWVFADGDESGKKTISSLKKTFKNWPKEHFKNFSKKYFENYYPKRFQEEFEVIMKVSDRRKRQEEKTRFTSKVLIWIQENKVVAKKEFFTSAKEIINHLKQIETSLK